MKTLLSLLLAAIATTAFSQSIVGKWQLSETKTCFLAEMKESETEKELAASMGSTSAVGVARVMELGEKGQGEKGVFSTGKKKATSKEAFRYQVSGNELQILDKKSGLVTRRWIIDELTDTSLKIHDAVRDCETEAYIKVQ